MFAYLIKNKYIISKNFDKLLEYFIEAANNHNVDLQVVNNIEAIEIFSKKDFKRPDFVIFWDKDVKLAKYLESIGIKVFNSSESIRLCDDKSLTYLSLNNLCLKQPKTVFSPLIYYHNLAADDEYIDFILSHFSFPFVFKECFGSFGQQVYLINSKEELIDRIKKCDVWPFVIQEFIKESKGRDLRIYVVGDKVVGAMKRENKNGDFRANIEIGGIASKYEANELERDLALKVAKELRLSFCGVDILFGKGDDRILCEVNSNAYFTKFNEILGINVADLILDHILNIIK